METRAAIGRYQVVRRIGQGGMAEVFECKLGGIGGFDKRVVIKRILPHLAEEPHFVEMFLDEARVAANLNHPNVIHVYEIDADEGLPYIVMEYVGGVSLRQIVQAAAKTKHLDPKMAAKIIAGVALGLDHAHNATDPQGRPLGIVHRDVTPHNILVTFDGIAKLLDFGVAKAASRLTQTEAGGIKGKLAYLAPEYLQHNQVDARCDVFMTGVTLYQATTGKLPFVGANEMAVLKAIVDNDVTRPTTLIPDYPPLLEQIVLWAMHPDPEQRCPSARSLFDALESYTTSLEPPVDEAGVAAWVEGLLPGAREDARRLAAAYGAGTGTGTSAEPMGNTPSVGSQSYRPSAAANEVTVATSVTPVPPLKSGAPVWLWAAGGAVLAVCITLAVILAATLGGTGSTAHAEALTTTTAEARGRANANLAVFLDEAERLAAARQYSTALGVLDKARDVGATDAHLLVRQTTLRADIEASVYRALAERALASGDADKAIENAKRVLDRNATDAEALDILARARSAAVTEAPDAAPSKMRGARPSAGRHARVRGRKAAMGELSVTSTPAATLYIDDEPAGQAPLAARRLDVGVHTLEARLDGYRPVTRTVRIDAGATASIALKLEPARAPAHLDVAAAAVVSAPTPAAPSDPKLATPSTPAAPAPVETAAPKIAATSASPVEPAAAAKAKPKAPGKPRLPAVFTITSMKDLARTFSIIEREVHDRGSVETALCSNVTAPLAQALMQKLSPGETIEVYPRAMYYAIVEAAAAGKSHAQIAAAITEAHRSGALRARSDD